MKHIGEEIYKKYKGGRVYYNEEEHCPLLLQIMIEKGRISAFCTEINISLDTFYNWCRKHPVLQAMYEIGKTYAREEWEKEGDDIKNTPRKMGMVDSRFEHWKLIGWSRFGISKNSRIKLDLDPKDSPDKHYSQLLSQASKGDFTAAEIKQLMEAVNVGLNTHQAFELQKEIDQLKADLALMSENTNAHNTSSN